MSRLIDADKMCDDLATVDRQYETMIDWAIRVTKAQPTVDAVPVVRCKDCKYNKEHHPFNGKERITVFWCEMENRNARHNNNPDWFCADWKRKMGDVTE